MPAIECHTLLTHSDFIMRNHRVHDVSVMPGVTFLDIVYRILIGAGWEHGRVTLREVLFTEAIVTKPDADREIRVTIAEPDDGVHEVLAESRWVREGEPLSDWRRNLTCELVLADRDPLPDIDPAALKDAAVRQSDMEELYARARAEDISHGDPMKCAGRLHHGDDYLLAELRPIVNDPDHERFYLHPARLDASTLAGLGLTQASGQEPFIPFYISEFRAPERLPDRFHVYAPRPETLAPSGDVISNDYGIYDERGRFVASFTGLACKRIRFPGLIEKLLETEQPAVQKTEGTSSADGLPGHLRAMVAEHLGKSPDEVPTDVGFYDLGLDSVTVLAIGERLEQLLGRRLYPTLLFEHGDIDSLAAHLADAYDVDLPFQQPEELPAQERETSSGRTLCYRDTWVPQEAEGSSPPEPQVVIAAPERLTGSFVRVEPGGDFDRSGESAYRLDPRDRRQLGRMLADLGSTPRHIAVFPLPGGSAADACLTVWSLACALVDQAPQDEITITFVHESSPEHAAVAALARTISAETPVIRCRSVALDDPGLLGQALRDPSDESEIRYTRDGRMVRRWLPYEPEPGQVPIKRDGVYVIAGGTGGIGRHVAEHLERRHHARPVAIGRSAEVRADLTDRDEVERALDTVRARYGRIDGVIHCAGVNRDGAYFRQQAADIEAVVAPKALGVKHLDDATKADDLDFFVVFSSLSASLPNPGQAGYGFANAYLEEFALRREGPGRTLAIGWPYWADGGMQVGPEALERARKATGLSPLPTGDALEVLDRALAGAEGRFVVLHGEGDRVTELLPRAVRQAEVVRQAEDVRQAADVRQEPAAAHDEQDGIAIVGLAGRYPQAPDLDAFWRNLAEGRDCITEVPADRWDHEALFDPEKGRAGKTYGKWGGFIDGVDRFDPAFFGISRRDAERMDPQERLFLQTCWHTLEDAGYPPDTLTGENVGVFAGVMWNHYQLVEGGEGGVAPTAMHASIANRVSYTFDFDGPSLALDTACSSSLTAVHLAIESLRRGECTLALAGGVNATVHPQKYLQLAQGRWLSTDGRCRAFAKGSSGYVPGEGSGAVLLKPLSRARRDGDHIYGVIAASAVNHTGRTSGATVPSPASQAELIDKAVRRSGWDPATITYVEAHGTGTSLGDPIEVEGMRKALDTGGDTCAIGSVKSNIGHLEGAAGIAGLTKVLLQMKHGQLVPSLHTEELNPQIDFAATRFRVQRELAPWPGPRRAGVSAFGAGGTNAHVLLEEYGRREPRSGGWDGPCLFVLSARTREALRDYAAAYVTFLQDRSASGGGDAARTRVARLLGVPESQIDPDETLGDLGLDPAALVRLGTGLTLDSTVNDLASGTDAFLDDLAYTSQVGRTALAVRLALVVSDVAELRARLEAFARGDDVGFSGTAGSDGDAEPEEYVRLFRTGRLRELAEQWVRGGRVPWRACYPRREGDQVPRRVSLPAYPFQEERCWIGRWRGEDHRPERPATQPASRPATQPVTQPATGPAARPAAGPATQPATGPAKRPATQKEGEDVRFSVDQDGVALVAMESTMFTQGLIDGLQAAFAEIARRDDVKAVVVTGSDKVFSMGATPDALQTLSEGQGQFTDVPFLYEGLLKCDRPVITAIQGHASGGGLAFGLYADVVHMAREGVYSANFMKFGFTPGMGSTYVLEERFGRSLAHEMLFTGRQITGEELERRGANVSVLPQAEVLKVALRQARSIAGLPPRAVRALKGELAGRVLQRLDGVIAGEVDLHARVLGEESSARVRDHFAKVESFRTRGDHTPEPTQADAAAPVQADAATAQAAAAPAQVELAPVERASESAERVSEPAAPAPKPPKPASEPAAASARAPEGASSPPQPGLDPGEVRQVVESTLMAHLYLEPHEIDESSSFSEMGLDSIGAVEIVRDLNRRFDLDLDSVAVYDHPTLPALVEHVAGLDAATPPPLREEAPPPAEQPPAEQPAAQQPAAQQPAAQQPPAQQPPARRRPVTDPGQIQLTPLAKETPPTAPTAPTGDIAVIGMAGRFPDAPDLESFWNNLAAGRTSIREIPSDRFDIAAAYDPDRSKPDKTYSKHAAMLSAVDEFDAAFFNLSPLEAEAMDPQQRLFLQEAWHAMEDAGYAGGSGGRRPWGVFVGCAAGDYARRLAEAGLGDSGQAFLGNTSSVLPARIAYLLNFGGPTMAVDTACSSSLVAVHLACESIRRGECDAAVAGGVAVMTTAQMHIWCSNAGMLSPSGACAPFDESADGIVLGEGVGAVVLKRLDQALADGDHVHGVIRAGGVNGDGSTNGITAPSAGSQAELIKRVQRLAGVTPDDVGYVEAHGTGTSLGDPIEVKALAQVFGERERPCGLGSLKANIGHTTMAAGIGGLLKTLLALRHRKLPPSPNFSTPNPKIDFGNDALEVVTELTDWEPGPSGRRTAAVSSFGFSGTNCHVVLSEAPDRPVEKPDGSQVVVPVSAHDEAALARLTGELAGHLAAHPGVSVRDVAYTLAVGRPHLPVRAAVVARDLDELVAGLRGSSASDSGGLAERYRAGEDVNWAAVWAERPGRRIPLPTYPFARERFWVDSPAEGRVGAPDQVRPDDWIVADHRLGDTPVLPGTACLAMAADRSGMPLPLRLSGVRWLRPFEVNEPRPLHMSINRDNGKLTFELGDEPSAPYARGSVSPAQAEPEHLDLRAVEERCPDRRSPDDVYAAFDHGGLHYGPAFRVIRDLHVGRDEALSRLTTSARSEDGLHPELLDGALQTIVALRPEDASAPALPYAAESVEVLRPLTSPAYAHARCEGKDTYTVQVTDDQGQVCVRFTGIALRAKRQLIYAPVWREAAATTAPPGDRALVLHTPADEPLARALAAEYGDGVLASLERIPDLTETPFDTVYVLARTGDPRSPAEQDPTTLATFRLVKRLIEAGYGRRDLTLKVVLAGAVAVTDEETIVPHAAGLIGLTRAVGAEHPRWSAGCVDVGAAPPYERDLARRLRAEDCAEPLVALREDSRLVRVLEPRPAAGSGPYRQGGAYLVVGGAGGIGRTLSRHLARTAGARLALIGRSPSTPEVEQQLAEVESLGGQAVYLRADVADAAALGRAVAEARERFGPLHGAFHAALVLRDMTIANMEEADLSEVLAPKVAGAAAFAEALRDEPLDFLAYFSSAASFVEPGGQANYAAASTFEDSYALSLARLGRPVSVINWGYWGSVGAVAGEGYGDRFASIGIGSIEPEEGMAALSAILQTGVRQALVVKGEPEGLARIGIRPARSGRAEDSGSAGKAGTPETAGSATDTAAEAAGLERARAAFAALDELARALLRRTLSPVLPDERTSVTDLERRLRVTAERRRLLDAVLHVLESSGAIRREGDELVVRAEPADEPDPAALLSRFPDLEPHVRLLSTCVDALTEVLSGDRDPVEVLFPGGSTSLVEQVYRGQSASDYFNRVLAGEAADAVRRLRGRGARVLEIGAGTGASTAFILPELAELGEPVDFTYTDISPAFLRHGEQEYGERYPFVSFTTFDVERDPAEQGLQAEGYDVVLATNVLHATADIQRTLANAARLLRPGGVLLINEVTRLADFLTLTFGLTPGWWRFADGQRRLPHGPLLSPAQWQEALAAAGLPVSRTRGIPGTPVEEMEQCVLTGERQAAAAHDLGASVRTYVKNVFAEVLKYRNADFDEHLTFENFGVDSLVSQNIIHRFEQDLGELGSTLLFEHLTIEELAGHLMTEHEQRLRDLLRPADPPADPPAPAVPVERPRRPQPEQPEQPSGSLDIAVVGIAGRYPRSPDLDTFWNNLAEGVNCITEVPKERFDLDELFDPKRGRKQRTYSRWGGFIEGADEFDAGFFGILPRDAEITDPQERLFLETTWNLLEDAGYLSRHTKESRTGVFVGTMYGSYGRMAAAAGWPQGRFAGAHSAYWSIANRVSYFFDLQGPSFAVDSACSSSLTAVQLACESLRRGECRLAIAGGVNLILHPAHYVSLCSLNMLSGDDACKVFDESADGFVPGEGVGAVLLKPLADAEADGDVIHGVIKGAFANAGGKTAGYTVPNPNAQAELVTQAMERAGVDPRTVTYVEAHGTGTALGDPIEIASLTKAFRGAPERCAVGSVKANIGHLEGAAGIAGLTKVLLQMRHGRLAPCANLGTPNPKIDFAGSPFYPPTEQAEWPRPTLDVDGGTRTFPRRAGVSSFGAGGANVHLVVEEYAPERTGSGTAASSGSLDSAGSPGSSGEQLVVLSARTRDQLRALAGSVAEMAQSGPSLPELAYTSQVGRAEMTERLAVRATGVDELASRLRAFASTGEAADGVMAGTAGADSTGPELLDDGDGIAFLRTLAAKRQLAKLGRLWVLGADVDWAELWPRPRPRRVSLPSYPFDRRRYWLPEDPPTGQQPAATQPSAAVTEPSPATTEPSTATPPPAAGGAEAEDVSGWSHAASTQPGTTLADEAADARCTYLRPVWERAAQAEGDWTPNAVLVIGDGEPEAELAAVLEAQGTRCITADLDPRGPEDAKRLAEELDARGELPDALVHILSDPFPGPDPTALAAGLDRSFYTLLWTATAILDRSGGRLRAVVAQAGPPDEPRPHHAALAAVLRTLALEHSGFSGASVALENTSAPRETAEHILAELRAADQDAAPENRVNELRYRSGARWHRRLEPFQPSPPDLRLRDEGSYLITGGAGAIGMAVAEFLAGQGRVNLVLTGRSQLDDATRARVEALPATYVRADVQSGGDLARLVREHGPFHGVIHAAGVHRDARAVQKQRAEAESVLAPKVLGTVLLDEALGEEPLDFLVLFSSVAAETGNIGQVDYAYANAFLHHYAEMRERSRRGRTVAIGWPLWEEGGMTVDDATRRLFERRWGSVPMSTAAGLTAFARGLAGAESAFAVMEGPSHGTDSHRTDSRATSQPRVSDSQADGADDSHIADSDIDDSDIDYGELVSAELRRAAAGFLLVGEEHVDLDTNLMDSGFDSISLSELVDQVNERYGLDLLPTVAFEASTLAAFGDFLVANHRRELAKVHAAPRTQAKPQEPAEPVSAPEVTHPSPRSGAEASPEHTDGIAIIGMAGTLPGSPDLDTFWRHLADGDDLIRDVPEDRADLRENPDTANVRAGFLDDVGSFDAALFGISPKEAALMDPQQRLFLQTVWRTIEDAGYRPSALAGTRTGLFAGVSACDYDDLLREHGVPVEAHTASGVAGCILANRVSHFLDLHGPSEAIDTACSSSLVALHRAARAIEAGECEAAIAGGVNLTLSPGLYIAFGKSGMISDDGTCKTFDERADGYGRGEGCGAVLLKPLSAALADGDQVLAVIKGSAVNHGGRASSLTAPNPEAQARVLVDAYRKAGIDPATVTYLEAHGTGTRLGDPIEIEGMKKAFAELYTDWDLPAPGEPHVAVTSVKTNIGHLEAAAGIAGLLKVLLCMKYGELPPTLHYDQPNPYLRLEGTPFFINDRLRPWDGVAGEDGAPVRRAGLSSFGFGGTNAHVVLEAYERPPAPSPSSSSEGGPQVLVLSARTPEALDGYAREVARFLGEHPEIGLDRVAYTLQVGREPMRERLAVVVEDRDEAVRALTGEAGAPQLRRGRAGKGASGPAGDGLDELAQAWVEGAEVEWLERWPEPRPLRASLPSFPFERTKHWFKTSAPRREPSRRGPSRQEPSRREPSRREPSRQEPSRQEPLRQDSAGRPKVRLRAAGEGASSAPDGSRRTRLASTGSKATGSGDRNGSLDAASAADVVSTAKTAGAAKPTGNGAPPSTEQLPAVPAGSAGGASGVEELLRERLATILDTDPSGVAPDTPFGELGLDSIFRMELVKSLNTAFSLDLQASELYEYDTVDRLTRAVEEAINESGPAPAEPQPSEEAVDEGSAAPAEPPQQPQQQPGAEEALTSLVSSIIGRPLDPGLTFEKNGLTSFEMLRTVSTLEKRAGALHKTLLFDHPTVEALAAHLGADALHGIEEQSAPDLDDQEQEEREGEPLVIAKRRLPQRPELREVIDRIDREHAKEGGLAGRDIAPLAFLGSAREGYLNFSRIDGNLLAWSYAGPEDHFLPVVEEYVAYAQGNGLKPNFLSLIPVTEVAGKPYTATPFGAVQRLENLGEFTLKGGRMERLRYMVRRFGRAGGCRTVEYRSGDDPALDREAAELVDRWAAGKQMVNPYVAVVKQEIAEGRLDRRHRVFLTYLDDTLVNAIVITKIPSENAYLLDVEFYSKDMPLGGLEFAITKIIEVLVAEGITMFSFGASFGVEVEDGENAAPDVKEALDELRSMGIFGEGNFQFKNKFRPANIPIYLCQPDSEDRTSVSDVILMIADPPVEDQPAETATAEPPATEATGATKATKATEATEATEATGTAKTTKTTKAAKAAKTTKAAKATKATKAAKAASAKAPVAERGAGSHDVLAAHGHNPVRLPAEHVEFDLITDSWAELDSPFIRERMRDLADRSAGRPDAPELAGAAGVSWLPFPLAVPTGSGRSAEALLCRSWPGPRGAVVHNGLFPTWYPSLVDAGFEPVQIPGSGGDVDTDALRHALAERDRVSFVCVEVSNNAAGGYPASLENLRRVRELCTQYGVPLVIDGARIVENALFAADGRRPVWDVVSDILALADCATVSLSKDFGVTSGGLVATRDEAVAAQIRERIATHGRDVDLATRKVIATALEDTDAVAAQVGARMEAVAALWQRLSDAGVPVVEPVAGHCVLIDVGRMEAFAGHDHPVMSCLAWMYRQTGVRGGPHLGREGLIRLAVPVGFGVERAEAVAGRLAEAFAGMAEVPHLVTDGSGGAQAEYRPAETVPEDVQEALREQHRPDNDNLNVLREHNARVEQRVVDGVEVFSAGSGPTLLLMTPFNIGAGVYAKQFASLTDRYRLVCVHHPGVGATTAAADITLDGIATLCHDVLDGGFPVHVAGASFGGLSALAFALAYPRDTASLVLIGSSHRIGNRVGEINRLDVVAKEDFDHVIAESGSERLRGERDELQRILLRSESMNPQIGLRYLDVFAERPDFLARLPEIEVPTLIVQGRHDTVIPQKTAHLLHGAIPGAEYAEVADAGHFPQLSSADEVNDIIAGFLGRTR